MNDQNLRWQQHFENYKKALLTIEEVIPKYSQLSELEKDGLMHRFEFTLNLAWNVMQEYLKYAGYTEIMGMRASITQMAQDGLVDGFVWDDILTARNELSHIFTQDKSHTYLDNMVNDLLPSLQAFRPQMEEEPDNT